MRVRPVPVSPRLSKPLMAGNLSSRARLSLTAPVNDRKTNLAQLRSHVGMVFQRFELFPPLIIEKLTLAQVKGARQKAKGKGLKLERVGLSAHAG